MSFKLAIFVLMGALELASSRQTHPDVQGANFILPALVSTKELELERQDPFFLETACEGRRYAGYGVDEDAFKNFVTMSEPSCEVAVQSRIHDWKPETTKYLHSLWKVHRLLTSMTRPGGGSLEESADYFEDDLVSTSHSVETVLKTIESAESRKLSHLIENSLGKGLASLSHPSREGAQEVLNRIKSNFNFYHGDKCLVKEHGGKSCGDEVQRLGTSGCEGDERNHMCSFTEVYRCPKCGASFRFPRYRSIPKLLETKLGRCGEFSDVALGVFRELGYDSRLVIDHTDHVWVELNLPGPEGQAVFTHADPSEGILDQPFLYQDNWKKSLTFVFAHTADSVEDRSNIYWHPETHKEMVRRRGMADEDLERKVFDANIKLERYRGLEEQGEADPKHENEEEEIEQARAIKGVADLEHLADELEVTASLLESRIGSL